MFRVLVIVVLAYAICFPRLASGPQAGDLAAYRTSPSRAERLIGDMRNWLSGPLQDILAVLNGQRAT